MENRRERLQVTFVDENNKDFSMSFSDFADSISLADLEQISTEIIDSKALRSKDALAKEFKEAKVITVSERKIV